VDATFQATQESTTSALPLLDRRSYGVETALVTPTGTQNLLQIRDGIVSAGWKGKKTAEPLPGKLLGSPGCWNGGLSKEVGLGVFFFYIFSDHYISQMAELQATPIPTGRFVPFWFLFIIFGDIFQPHCEHFLFDE